MFQKEDSAQVLETREGPKDQGGGGEDQTRRLSQILTQGPKASDVQVNLCEISPCRPLMNWFPVDAGASEERNNQTLFPFPVPSSFPSHHQKQHRKTFSLPAAEKEAAP